MNTVFQDVPFDLAAADRMEGWRKRFAWPLPHDAIYQMAVSVARAFVCYTDEIEDPDLQDVFTLIGPVQLATLLSLLETALWVQHASEVGVRLSGGPREVYVLRGEESPESPEYTEPSTAYAPPLRNRLMRRMARTASWTPWYGMPAALVAPTATAVSHNSLLRSHARKSSERVNFVHAESLLDAGRRRVNGSGSLPDFGSAIDQIGQIVKRCTGLEEGISSTVVSLFADKALPIFESAFDLVEAAKAVPRLPDHMWAGTGGYRPARALRIEARRRGGTVTGFDHSGSSGFIRETEGLAFTEFSVSDKFVATTPGTAALIKNSDAPGLIGGMTEIVSGTGDPSFGAMATEPWDGPHDPPRVLYVSGAYIGFRQRYPSRIPDILKLDWQLRFAEMLNKLPVDLLAQMHPGGLMRGKVHPVGQVATLSNRNFEEVFDWADVFVFDVVQSTTFTLALCSDRPVVLIDHGMNKFSDELLAMLRRRCTILNVSHDDRNLPQIDQAALEEAVCDSLKRGDPSEFRALFAGDFA